MGVNMSRNKIRFGLAGVLALTLTSPLFAADMPVKAPLLAPAVVYNWTGFYSGGEAGWKSTTDNWNTTCVDAGGPPLGTCGSALSLIDFPGAPDGSANNSFKTSGFRPGVYGGVQSQFSTSWVVGVEADYGFYNKTSTIAGIPGCSTAACTGGVFGPGPFTGDSTSVKLGDDYGVRLRAGYLLTPSILAYGTGGVAFQKISTTVVCSDTGAACTFPLTDSQSTTLIGYTVGGGLEWKIAQNWMLRGEYRYSNFGSYKPTYFSNSGVIEVAASQKVSTQIATAGLAYFFPVGQ
jgi:outer membrane immunogenic protein